MCNFPLLALGLDLGCPEMRCASMWEFYVAFHFISLLVTYELNGVFGKRSYHAKNVPSLLPATVLTRNGIYRTWQWLSKLVLCRTCTVDSSRQKVQCEWTDLQSAGLPEPSRNTRLITGSIGYTRLIIGSNQVLFRSRQTQNRQTRDRHTWAVGNPRSAQSQLWQTMINSVVHVFISYNTHILIA